MAKRDNSIIDENWEARMDADTLARAEEIKANNRRLQRAKKAATQEAKKHAQTSKKISKLKPTKGK